MLRLTPEIAKHLRTMLSDMSTEELIAVRETMPVSSKKVDEAFLNFVRNNINVFLKSRKNVALLTLQVKDLVKLQTKQRKQQADNRKVTKTVTDVMDAMPPRTPDEVDLFARILQAFS